MCKELFGVLMFSVCVSVTYAFADTAELKPVGHAMMLSQSAVETGGHNGEKAISTRQSSETDKHDKKSREDVSKDDQKYWGSWWEGTLHDF